MNANRSLTVLGVLAFCTALGLLLGRPSIAQPPAGPPAATSGRYQIEIKPNFNGGNFTTVFVVDTQSGQCWHRDTSSETKSWTDMGSPAQKPTP